MNNLSYYKNLQGVMTQFEPLTEADLQKVDADGLTIPEIRNALICNMLFMIPLVPYSVLTMRIITKDSMAIFSYSTI